MNLPGSLGNKRLLCAASIALYPLLAAFAPDAAGHADPIVRVLLALILILAVAKLGGEVAERIGMPAVLGELVGGVLLGNLVLLNAGWDFFEPVRVTPISVDWAVILAGLAQLGVIILLFEVGLESTVQGMLKVGPSAFLVAVLGVIAPSLLGFGVSWFFIKEMPAGLAAIVPPGFSLNYVHLFVGTVLSATSVGITARVFKDLNRLQQKEAQIILGAAVIDDVLGLVILAAVSGIITSAAAGKPPELSSVIGISAIALVFLAGSLAIGAFLVPKVMNGLARMRTRGVMLISALVFAFGLSYLSGVVGLAPIVGAFAAGLLLEDVHFKGFRHEFGIEKLVHPISTFLVPVFFVLMGIQVRLETFADTTVLGIAAGLTLAALIGKQICGLGVLEKGLDRLTVGVGMIPRGEVGLIFANIGKSLRVLDDAVFSAIVIMVIVSTLITPPILKWTLSRKPSRAQPSGG
jgi:Kef-type K+ transport system membrane component KefB